MPGPAELLDVDGLLVQLGRGGDEAVVDDDPAGTRCPRIERENLSQMLSKLPNIAVG